MVNPYESPQTPPDPGDRPHAAGHGEGKYLRGFFSAMLMTFVFTALFGFPLQQALIGQLPKSLWILAFVVSSPATSGPVFALILWSWNRARDREFAVGAVYFGVAAFLLVGGCFVALGR